jgi:hypothetical protein
VLSYQFNEATGTIAHDQSSNGYNATLTSPSMWTSGPSTASGVTYTPKAGFTGTDSFSYTESDGTSTATGGGVDYNITASPLSIAAGTTTASLTITVTTDTLDENNETVIVNMGAPTNATLGAITTHTATITDDDSPPDVEFVLATSSDVESVGTRNIDVDLSAASGLPVTVPFTVSLSSTATNPAGVMAIHQY